MARAGLTRAAVVEAGARQADEAGLSHVTLAALAAGFGVRLPSLYKHVGGLDDLRRGVTVLALHELDATLTAAVVGLAGRDALGALARAYREYARRRPGCYEATLRAPDPDDAEHVAAARALAATVFAALRGYGLDGDDEIDAVRIARAGLHGFVSLEAAGGFGLPRDVDRTFDRLIETLHTGLTSAAST